MKTRTLFAVTRRRVLAEIDLDWIEHNYGAEVATAVLHQLVTNRLRDQPHAASQRRSRL